MSIEQKIAEILAESRNNVVEEEVEQIDEISTKTLAKAASAASDPDADYAYDKYHDPQKFADYAKKTKSPKAAAAVQKAADAVGHFPRPGHTAGYDPLENRKSARTTATGKAYKQDVSTLKTKIKDVARGMFATEQYVEEEEEVKMMGAENAGPTDVTRNASAQEANHIVDADDGETECGGDNPDNAKNNVDKQEVGGRGKTSNVANANASAPEASNIASMKEDIDALVNGENLTEEFKQKAATIFEAAVMNRVKQEVAKLDESYQVALNEEVEAIKEGLVEKVDGYLDYVVEQWMEQNEIALESGMKSEILEGFVGGLKSLFEEHYIDLPDEKLDVLGALEEEVEELNTKLDEQFQSNVELKSELSKYQVMQVIDSLSEGLVETDKEKFHALIEELEFDGIESFEKKAQTIRESYFTGKTTKQVVNSVVTDEPVHLTEDKYVAPQMRTYLSVLDNLK